MAYCVVIERHLQTEVCPIRGKCPWAHRQSGMCKYSEENQSLSITELASLLGHVEPNEAVVTAIKGNIRQAVIDELK